MIHSSYFISYLILAKRVYMSLKNNKNIPKFSKYLHMLNTVFTEIHFDYFYNNKHYYYYKSEACDH